ncbi:MAG: guanosine monophosphate reductase [Actinomycetia bacterium]|nr:guanosine monophosphate reductase [Actinomycetes bacterium]
MNPTDFPLALAYDDVLLVPRRSAVGSRQEVSLATRLSRRLNLELPVIAANMDTVCEWEMAVAMARMGGVGIIHRFLPVQNHAREVEKVKQVGEDLLVGAALGVGGDMTLRAKNCVAAGVDVLVLDIAHGHAEHSLNAVRILKDEFSEVDLIAGNIATGEGAVDLVEAGADAVKVGVGPGGVCTTRVVTGVGVPQVSALYDVVRSGVDAPIIADGGIRAGGDIAKALALGADSVMIGSLLAGTRESPGEVEETSTGPVKRVRGMASLEAALLRAARRGAELEDEYFEHRSPEGIERRVAYRGTAEDVIRWLMGGVRSAMSYLGATDLGTFQRNARFVRTTPAGLAESHPHASAGR